MTGNASLSKAIPCVNNAMSNPTDVKRPRDQSRGLLTTAGLQNIAAHKYKSGHFTNFDNFMNPIWTYLTGLLPIWLAPNMVTSIGALHCGISYGIYWFYSPNFDAPVPDWVVFLSGYCTVAYFTLDCMDGKQARRTGQSSPLGQLFDHGFDCICNLAHVSSQAGMLGVGGSIYFYILHGSIFFAFFMAQWEEYYTGKLPHAMGEFGVTEANYGMGLFFMINAFWDREKFWKVTLEEKIPASALTFIESHTGLSIPNAVLQLEWRHACLVGWSVTAIILMLGSLYRVLTHTNVTAGGLRVPAISKLFTPLLVILAPLLLPANILANGTRYISLSSGLLMSLVTIKIICFAMAKQTFASIQIEAIPLFAMCLWMKLDKNITEEVANILFGALCFWYSYRLLNWTSTAISQICDKLDINCFTIKEKKVDDADAWKTVCGKQKDS